MQVIVTGNPFDGLTLYGPFEDYDAALDHAEKSITGADWWIVRLENPAALVEESAA